MIPSIGVCIDRRLNRQRGPGAAAGMLMRPEVSRGLTFERICDVHSRDRRNRSVLGAETVDGEGERPEATEGVAAAVSEV